MIEPAVPPAPRKRRRRLLLLLVPLSLLVAGWLYLSFAGQWRLARAIAETDRIDPHWRLEDIEAERDVVPNAENAAPLVIAANAQMPANWSPDVQVERLKVRNLKSNVALTEEQTTALRAILEPGAAALPAVRLLADRPRGRWPAGANLWVVLETARRMSADALLRTAEGDLDGALASCCAGVNCGRSIGDEPSLMPQLVRAAVGVVGSGPAERALGQGEPSEAALAALQKLLAEEAEAPLFMIALRGERAGQDRCLESVQRGEMSVKQFRAQVGWSAPSRFSLNKTSALYVPGVVAGSRAAMLEQMNKVIEICKLPREERAAPVRELVASLEDESPLVLSLAAPRTLLEYMDNMGVDQARLGCAAVGLAAERYRRKHGRWPEGLDDLKGEFLSRVPLDPRSGKPLGYLKTDEGAVVYSVGPDGKGDPTNGWGICFRLWDVDKRRQPPPPPKPPRDPSPAPESRR